LSVVVTDDTLSVDLEDGRTVSVPIGWYPRLAHGTAAERANLQISGAGYGVHWPDLDEEIGVEGLLLGKRSSESAASFPALVATSQRKAAERCCGISAKALCQLENSDSNVNSQDLLAATT
jgi:hypothetical protein